MKTIGYARVSTDDQTSALQLDALRAAGSHEIFDDAAGGVRRDRPGLTGALAAVGRGDVLVVWRLDRLGRSLRHLLEIVESLRDRGVALRSLTEAVDTSTATGKLVYGILGSIAEFERELIRERTVSGIRAARRRGIHCGRRRGLSPSQVELARFALTAADATIAHVARQMRVSRATLYRELSMCSKTREPTASTVDGSFEAVPPCGSSA
jgi:DNA invertase Pin-like site-specific DNA recombinase